MSVGKPKLPRKKQRTIEDEPPLKLEGEKGTPRIASGAKRLKSEGLPWVEFDAAPEEFEGDIVTIDQLVGYLVMFQDFQERPSSYDEGIYMFVQVQVGDDSFILRTGSRPVCGSIKHMKHLGKIPFRAFVVQGQGRAGRPYYALAGPTPEDEGD